MALEWPDHETEMKKKAKKKKQGEGFIVSDSDEALKRDKKRESKSHTLYLMIVPHLFQEDFFFKLSFIE